jgi:hypothetical protein
LLGKHEHSSSSHHGITFFFKIIYINEGKIIMIFPLKPNKKRSCFGFKLIWMILHGGEWGRVVRLFKMYSMRGSLRCTWWGEGGIKDVKKRWVKWTISSTQYLTCGETQVDEVPQLIFRNFSVSLLLLRYNNNAWQVLGTLFSLM